MANPNARRDPLPAYAFKVTLTLKGFAGAEGFFRSVGGLRFETSAEDVKAGGVNNTTLKIVGARKFSNLVLKRGLVKGGNDLYNWVEEWNKEGPKSRADVTISQLDNSMNVVATWQVSSAFPVKWEVSDLDASKSELAIETLELAFEGLDLTLNG